MSGLGVVEWHIALDYWFTRIATAAKQFIVAHGLRSGNSSQ